MKYKVEIEGEVYEVEVLGAGAGGECRVRVGGKEFTARVDGAEGVKKRRLSTKAVDTGEAAVEARPASGASTGPGTIVSAPMAGRVTRVYVKQGGEVKQGQLLFILEAMKMENEITSPCDGRVAEVMVKEGANVGHSSALCRIE